MPDTLTRLLERLRATPPVTLADPVAREAAVALILAPDPDRLLLIRRAERQGDPWSGHLALPGGRRDPTDEDLLTTAIRETHEEVGIELTREECGAVLDDLGPVSPVLPPMVVRPFVFVLSQSRDAGSSEEVAEATWVTLAALATPGIYHSRRIPLGPGYREVSGYDLPGGFLWGMTERMVTPVVRIWQTLSDQG